MKRTKKAKLAKRYEIIRISQQTAEKLLALATPDERHASWDSLVERAVDKRRVDEAAGQCYQAAFYMLEATRDSKLCHGVVTRTKPPHERMGHAWIEVDVFGLRFCFDGLYPGIPIPASQYYAIGNIEQSDVVRYEMSEAMLLSRKHGHYGPWEAKIASAVHANDPSDRVPEGGHGGRNPMIGEDVFDGRDANDQPSAREIADASEK